MARIVPADAQLRSRWAGRTDIGYRVLDIDRKLFRVFTDEQVEEVGAAHYLAIGGIEAPEAGGYIVWGIPGQDIAWGEIEPERADSTPLILDTLDNLLTRIAGLLPEPAPVIVDTSPFTASIEALRTEQSEQAQREAKRRGQQLTEIRTRLGALVDGQQRLSEAQGSNQAVTVDLHQAQRMDLHRLEELLIARLSEVGAGNLAGLGVLGEQLNSLRSEVERIDGENIARREAQRAIQRKRLQSIAAFDSLLEQVNERMD